MHWRRKLGIAICFTCMPPMAPLWALGVGTEIETMIRLLTPIFVIGLIFALGGEVPARRDEEE